MQNSNFSLAANKSRAVPRQCRPYGAFENGKTSPTSPPRSSSIAACHKTLLFERRQSRVQDYDADSTPPASRARLPCLPSPRPPFAVMQARSHRSLFTETRTVPISCYLFWLADQDQKTAEGLLKTNAKKRAKRQRKGQDQCRQRYMRFFVLFFSLLNINIFYKY